MGIFNKQDNTTPALVEAKEKLVNGAKLIVLAQNAFPEQTTSLEQLRIIFQRMPQDKYVVTTTSETPKGSEPVTVMLDLFGVDHVEGLHETDLQSLSPEKLINDLGPEDLSEIVINLQGVEIKFSRKDFDDAPMLRKLFGFEGKAFLALLSTLSRLQCRILLGGGLSQYIHFPEAYSLIDVENIVFVGRGRYTVNVFKEHNVKTVFTGSAPRPSSTPPAQKFAQALDLDFQAVLSSIIEENRRIFGLVLECGFNPLIEFIKAHEKEYFHDGECFIDLSYIFDELEKSNKDFAEERHRSDRLTWQWNALTIIPFPAILRNPFNELLRRVSDWAEHAVNEDKLLEEHLTAVSEDHQNDEFTMEAEGSYTPMLKTARTTSVPTSEVAPEVDPDDPSRLSRCEQLTELFEKLRIF